MRANCVRGVIVSGVLRTPGKNLNSVRDPPTKYAQENEEIHALKAPEFFFRYFTFKICCRAKTQIVSGGANSVRGFGRPGVHRNSVTPLALFATPLYEQLLFVGFWLVHFGLEKRLR